MVKIIFIRHVAAPLLKFFKEWLCLKCRVGDILPRDVLLRDILPRDILPRDVILVIYILHTTVKYHSSHIIESNSTQKCICIWLAVVLQECRDPCVYGCVRSTCPVRISSLYVEDGAVCQIMPFLQGWQQLPQGRVLT